MSIPHLDDRVPHGMPRPSRDVRHVIVRSIVEPLGTARRPELAAEPIGPGSGQPVGHDDALDHVGEYGDPGPTPQSHRHDRPIASSADRSIDTDQPGRAPEARTDQPPTPGLERERAGRRGEVDRGGRGG